MFIITDTALDLDIALVTASELPAFMRHYGDAAGLEISPA